MAESDQTFDQKAYNKAYHKVYYAANRDKIRAKHKAWLKANRDRIRVYNTAYRKANGDKRKAYERAYYAKNDHKSKAKFLKWKYGLSLEQFDKIFCAQGGKCAICGTKEFGKSGRQLDHCGKAGHVRGILCQRCNTAIGLMQHSPRIMAAAQKYLSKEVIFNQETQNGK